MEVALEAGKVISLDVQLGHTVVAYLFEGSAIFGIDENGQGEAAEAVTMILFEDGDTLRIGTLDSPARFMLMTGAPFKEPIFPYGPFVMNTREEIEQALSDLRNGTFVQA
jgi:quercetin 2,3-dioxygenase